MTTVKRLRGSETYHTRECHILEQSYTTVKEMDKATAEAWGLTECQRCQGSKMQGTRGCSWADRNQRQDNTFCRECNTLLGAGYLCDECDTVEGWPE